VGGAIMRKVKNPHVFRDIRISGGSTERITFEVVKLAATCLVAVFCLITAHYFHLLRTWIRSNTPANEARFLFFVWFSNSRTARNYNFFTFIYYIRADTYTL
jgi:hypothetical protein